MNTSNLICLRPILLSAVLLLCGGNRGLAQVAAWDVSGVSASDTPLGASSLGTNIASATLALGSGVNASSAADTFGASGFTETSLANALLNADYLSFTITPTAGFKLSISSVSFTTGVSTAVTNFNANLFSSSTGFTSSDSLYSYSFATTTAANQSVTLSGISALQDVTTSIEFRLYGYRDISGTSTYRIRNLTGSDLIINGTVTAVPEPSAYALLGGVGVLGVTVIRRFRKGNVNPESARSVSA